MKKNRKIKRFISLIKDGIKNFIDKLNWHYIVITVIILVGIGVLVGSYWISDPELKNIAVGLGTGIVTSALVTLCIDLMNARIEQRKLAKYKRMLLNPLCNSVKTLYVQIALSVNEYRVREEKGHYFLLPLEDTKELSHFFNEMKEIDIESVGDEEKKNRLVDFISVSSVYLKEVISQYEGLPFESLILDNIITQEEYDQLKRFTLVNECKKCLGILGGKTLSDKDRYNTSVQLLHCMMLFINRLMRIFDFIALKIETENADIKKHLDDIYYNEIYLFSDEYVEQWAERAEAEAEYYAEHPELLEEVEESEEEQLHRKINTAIWAGDVETIKACFPQIDKNNKQIQSELTWSVAKDVMKDKVLRELYFQKYGIFYYVWLEEPPARRNFETVLKLLGEAEVTEQNKPSKLDIRMKFLEETSPLGSAHPAVKQYNKCMRGAGDTVRSIIISANSRLAFLENKQVLRMLSKDDLNLAELGIGVNGDGETKTALFCVIPDSDKSYNFIIGMLYTQIFQELYYQADFNCGGRLPIHVTFMLDEFANVALPDDYCSLLSTMRSREISSIIIIQNFAQLKALFKDTWETIPGNCVRPEVASAI